MGNPQARIDWNPESKDLNSWVHDKESHQLQGNMADFTDAMMVQSIIEIKIKYNLEEKRKDLRELDTIMQPRMVWLRQKDGNYFSHKRGMSMFLLHHVIMWEKPDDWDQISDAIDNYEKLVHQVCPTGTEFDLDI